MSCSGYRGRRTFNSESVRREKLHMLPRNKMTLAIAMILMNRPWRFSRNGKHEDKRPSIPPPRRFSAKKGVPELIPIGEIGEGGDNDMPLLILLVYSEVNRYKRGTGNKREFVRLIRSITMNEGISFPTRFFDRVSRRRATRREGVVR